MRSVKLTIPLTRAILHQRQAVIESEILDKIVFRGELLRSRRDGEMERISYLCKSLRGTVSAIKHRYRRLQRVELNPAPVQYSSHSGTKVSVSLKRLIYTFICKECGRSYSSGRLDGAGSNVAACMSRHRWDRKNAQR
jgi:hypothetical protein